VQWRPWQSFRANVALSLGYSPSGTRIRKRVMARAKTEVREKLKELDRAAGYRAAPDSGQSQRRPGGALR